MGGRPTVIFVCHETSRTSRLSQPGCTHWAHLLLMARPPASPTSTPPATSYTSSGSSPRNPLTTPSSPSMEHTASRCWKCVKVNVRSLAWCTVYSVQFTVQRSQLVMRESHDHQPPAPPRHLMISRTSQTFPHH